MMTYPSIPLFDINVHANVRAYIFDKIDGNNLRFEFKKGKWKKFGSREELLSPTDKRYSKAYDLFVSTMGQHLSTIIGNNWPNANVTVFVEWSGPKSLSGIHVPDDTMSLNMLDVSIDGQTFVPPVDFLKLFKGVQQPRYLGTHELTHEFIESVIHKSLPGISLEGVVCKWSDRGAAKMCKIKTQLWCLATKKLCARVA